MTTFTEIIEKKNAIKWTPAAVPGTGLLTILDARKNTDYHVQPLATSWGRGFTLAKLDGSERYSVLIGKPGEHDRCDCAGMTYKPNAPHGCRHIQACKALIANNWLDVADQPAPTNATPTPDAALDALTALLFGRPDPAAKPVLTARDREMGDQLSW